MRCNNCNKKIKLISYFNCNCGNIYCMKCRYYDVHNCSHNYKNDFKEKINNENKKIVPTKLEKI